MPKTLEVAEKRRAEDGCMWRVSSTVFGHIASDVTLTPLGHFGEAPKAREYPITENKICILETGVAAVE